MMTQADANIHTLNDTLASLSLGERLKYIADQKGSAVFTTSLGIEDQVITEAIAVSGLNIRIATLETGRLFDETLALIDETEERLNIRIERYQPDEAAVAGYVDAYGRNGFYESVEARQACCHIRKLVPLENALKGADIWITGLRRGQSGTRASTPYAEYDAKRALTKVNPLADWGIDDIHAYVAKHRVPVNPLHERGYPSIGCAPCTRAIKPGEPERAGRWWWETDAKRECGLHLAKVSG